MGANFTPGKGNPSRSARDALERGTSLAAEHILGESNKRVPLEEGTLERSGAAGTEVSGEEVRGVVSYDTPYQRGGSAREHALPARLRSLCEVP